MSLPIRSLNFAKGKGSALLLLLLLTLLARTDAQERPPEPADPVAEVRRLIDAGRAGDAVSQLGGAPAEGDPRRQFALGLALYHAGDAARAIPLLDQSRMVLAEGAERAEATEVLGLSLMLAGRAADAVPHLQEAVASRRAPDVAHVLAQAAVKARQPDIARAALAVALGLDPARAEVFVAAGQLMARMDVHDLADAQLRAALERNAGVLQANYLLGQEALYRGRFDEAVSYTERELALNPLDAMAFVQLGDALGRLARWDEALPALQRAIWLNPFYSAPYILLGRGYLVRGQADLTEGMVRRAIEFDPNNRAAHYLLGQALQRLGQTDAAKAAFARAEALQSAARP